MDDEFELCDKQKARFKVLHYYPGASDEEKAKISEKCEQGESVVYIETSTKLSSLASRFLQQLYEQGKVTGKDILKASNVKVLLQVRPTWKPLPLSSFIYKQNESDLSLETVFGPLLNAENNEMVAHLHLCTDKIWTDETVREVVKQLLQNYSQTQLERLNCPFSQGMLSQISRDQYYCKVSAEKIRLFGAWYEAMAISKPDDTEDEKGMLSKRDSCLAQRSKKIVFSSSHELPILKASFETETHPSSQKMTEIAEELNTTEFRQTPGREKVHFRHVNNWFKNERARARKVNQDFSQIVYRTEYKKFGCEAECNEGNTSETEETEKGSGESETMSPEYGPEL